jgi:hypothetical protein
VEEDSYQYEDAIVEEKVKAENSANSIVDVDEDDDEEYGRGRKRSKQPGA